MDTVTFQSAGEIDLLCLRLMGVSAKETENPLGRFGTGLKYGIATLLRTGHEIEIFRGMHRHSIGAAKREFRNRTISIVTLDGDDLGFSLELGRDWEVWQAYRELRSNAMDEGNAVIVSGALSPEPGKTTIVVRGSQIAAAHERADEIFLPTARLTRLANNNSVEVFDRPSSALYFRGVVVADLPTPSRFTYNFLYPITLTEDRTMKYPRHADFLLPRLVQDAVTTYDIAERLLLTGKNTYEYEHFDWDFRDNKIFLDLALKIKNHAHFSPRARKELRKFVEDEIATFDLNKRQQKLYNRAMSLVRQMEPGFAFSGEIIFADNLGTNVLGKAKAGKIYLSRQAFEWGPAVLAGTILEEYLHAERGFADESREMQNYLLNRLAALAELLQDDD